MAARPRCQALWPFVASLHYHESDLTPVIERILPNGQAHVMINLCEDEFRTYAGSQCERVQRYTGAVFAGPHARTTAIDTWEQRWLVAVEFKPGGAAAFLRMPVSETADQILELGDVWGGRGRVLREVLCEAPTPAKKFAVLESALIGRLVHPRDPAIAAAVSLLDQGAPVADTSANLGLLPKTFLRRFREQVGLTPKRFARVRRMQRVVGAVNIRNSTDWCMLAAEHGYSDQAHLIHDFRDLTGITPTEYLPASRQRRNHVPVALARD